MLSAISGRNAMVAVLAVALVLWAPVFAGEEFADGARALRIELATSSTNGLIDTLSSPTGESVVTMTPGEVRTFIERYSFDAQTAQQIALVVAFPEVPPFVTFAFNAGVRVGQAVTIQYRLEVASDAPGGSYPLRIVYEFRNSGNAVVDTQESRFTLVIDAPPPPDDHGDDCDSATPLALGASADGEIESAGDRDFFRVEVTEAGTLSAFTTGSTDTVGTLLDQSCAPLIVDQDSGLDSNFSISAALSPGTYHVAVGHAQENGTGPYTLAVEFEALDPFEHVLYFPQFANGAGLNSQVTLLSLDGESATNALIQIRGDDGTPLDLGLNAPTGFDLGVGEGLAVAVPASGSTVLSTDGQGDAVAGSVTVRSDRPLAGVLVFGGAFGLAGVSDGPVLGGEMIAPVETGPGPAVNTGVALQNLEDTEVTFEARLREASGTLLATATPFSLPPRGHRALFVSQLQWNVPIDFNSGLRGVLSLRSLGGNYSAVVLLVRPGQLATLPVVMTAAPQP